MDLILFELDSFLCIDFDFLIIFFVVFFRFLYHCKRVTPATKNAGEVLIGKRDVSYPTGKIAENTVWRSVFLTTPPVSFRIFAGWILIFSVSFARLITLIKDVLKTKIQI